MRKPLPIHEQLISLQHISLDGRALDFTRAFISVSMKDGASSWSCTLRGVSIEEAGRLQGELELRAQAIDGRTVEGRVVVPVSLPNSETSAALELAGLESLLIEGRKL